MAKLRLGTVLAHPDDETFGTGGTLIRAVARGLEVHSLCLTRGDEGWMGDPDAPIATRETLGEVREKELREAAQFVGLASVSVRDYGDSKLSQVDPRVIEDDILAWLREHGPDILITWGPDGGYGHPDHVAAGVRCIAALERAGAARPKKVYRFVIYDRWVEGMKRAAPDWDLASITNPWRDEQLGALVTLTDEELRRKWAAMQLHRSQLPDLRKYEPVMRSDPDTLRHEAYLRHFPPQDGRLESDLF